MAARELTARMAVDGQPLTRVQQLDEQGGIWTVTFGVRRAEERLGVGGDRIAQNASVGERAQTLPLVAENRGRRANPILGRVLVTRPGPAEAGDCRSATVETVRLIRLEEDRSHL